MNTKSSELKNMLLWDNECEERFMKDVISRKSDKRPKACDSPLQPC